MYLPIELPSFQGDEVYLNLQDAYDTGDRQLIKIATDNLRNAVIKAAKDIRSRVYPAAADDGDSRSCSCPFEGGLSGSAAAGHPQRACQRDYRINIAGPDYQWAGLC